MKVFIAGPLLNEEFRDLKFYEEIASVCRDLSFHPFLPHLKTESIDRPANESLVFQQDFEGLQNSDILIAEISEPSHGVGGELMQAYFQRIPIICLVMQGRKLSRMVIGNPMVKKILHYKTKNECLTLLKKYLLSYEWRN